MIYFSGKYYCFVCLLFHVICSSGSKKRSTGARSNLATRQRHPQAATTLRSGDSYCISYSTHILFLAPGQYTIAAPHGYIFVGKMSHGSALKTEGFLLWRRLHAQRLLLRSVPSGSSWHPFKWSRVRNPMLKWHVNLTNVHMHITVIT